MDVSIDVETFATSRDAALLQIGAVAFDFARVNEVHEHLQKDVLTYNAVVDPMLPPYAGVRYDPKTREWWYHADRSRALCSILESANRGKAYDALRGLADWVPRVLGKRARVWAKPPQFDLAILRHNFELFGIECPWHWRQEADVRTITWAAQHVLGAEFHVPDIAAAGMIAHNALHDAAEQATLVQGAIRGLILHERRHGPGKRTAPRDAVE